MVATRGRTFKRPWRGSCHSSKLKSSSAPIGRKDSWCFHGVGSSNAPLLGSTAAEGLQRIGRTSIATRWRFCGLPQSASCSENFVIPPDVFGQTLSVKRAIIVGIGSLEAFLRERKKFILVQSSVIVGVGRREVLGVDPAAQFASVEGTVVIAVKLVEQLRGWTLRFGEIGGRVVVWIQRFSQDLRPCRRSGDERDGESGQYALSDAHVRVLRFDGDHIILSTVGASSDRKEECLSLKTASQIMSLSPIRGVSLRPHCYTNWQKILGRREGMFDNLRDGPVPCVGRGCDSIQFPKKSRIGRCEDAIASTLSPSDIAFSMTR